MLDRIDELKFLTLTELLDLLTEQTAIHVQLIARKATEEEFVGSRAILEAVQAEIVLRKNPNRLPQPVSGSRQAR